MLSISISKQDKHYTTSTNIVWEAETKTLIASRLINSTILTITTQEPKTIGEFAIRFNNMVELSNEDFELLSDIKDYELELFN